MMKRIVFIFIATCISTAIGLYFRPSYGLIGQLDWQNVMTKGYFVGSFSKFFSQTFLDESFYFVMRFTIGGIIGGFILSLMLSGMPAGKKNAHPSSKKKK